MYINTICGYYSNARLFGAEKHCNTILSTKSKYLSIKLQGSINLVFYDYERKAVHFWSLWLHSSAAISQ